MTDLRKAAEMALETLERLDKWLALRYGNELTPPEREVVKALRQALAQPEQECICSVKDMPFGKCCKAHPEQESFILDRGCWERGCVAYDERDGDAVNISAERVDKTAKSEHEPWPSVQCVCGGTIYFKYTPPISDYHEGWEEGFKAATLEHEPFIYVREDSERPFGGYEHCSEADAGAFPVYTAPMIYTPRPKREWVGLTVEEKQYLNEVLNLQGRFPIIDAIEAKLKEKNT